MQIIKKIIIIELIIACVFGMYLTKTRTIIINGGGVVEAEAETIKQAGSWLGEELEKSASSDEIELRTENKLRVENKLTTGRKINAVSAYSELDSCHYPTSEGCLTASGKIARVGMVATNLYPFGTKLKIGNKIYIVEDRISKKYNDRCDIFMGYGKESHQEALKFGIQYLPVEILNN